MGESGGEGRDSGEAITWKIVSAVAEAKNIGPEEVTQPLGEVIDADALERLVHHSMTDLRVTFRYAGYFVEVESDGTVAVYDARQA